MKNAKQKKRPLSVLLRGKSGLTLVEMIVTFALLCIFVVAAVGMFSSSASIYNKIRVISSAQNVCEIIMDKVAGEVAGAQVGAYGFEMVVADADASPEDGGSYLSFETGTCIAFYNRTGSPLYITTQEGYLLLHYQPVKSGADSLNAVDWTYDPDAYMGFVIEALLFSIVADSNVIQIDLTLCHSRTGVTYRATRYVECYNFMTAADWSKITWGLIPADPVL